MKKLADRIKEMYLERKRFGFFKSAKEIARLREMWEAEKYKKEVIKKLNTLNLDGLVLLSLKIRVYGSFTRAAIDSVVKEVFNHP